MSLKKVEALLSGIKKVNKEPKMEDLKKVEQPIEKLDKQLYETGEQLGAKPEQGEELKKTKRSKKKKD